MKNNIKNNFNKAAKIYNENAILQKKVAEDLVDFCLPNIKNSRRIIDLGSGTGFVHNIIHQKNYNSDFFSLDLAISMLKEARNNLNINSDINNLSLKNNSFDLAISSLALQWISNFDSVFLQIKNILTYNGSFCFSIIAKNSLENIKNLKIDNIAINDFPDINYLEKYLKIFSSYKILEKTITLKYDNYYDLLQSIKKIGANHSFDSNSKLTISDLKKLMNIKNISENWNIIYIIANK